MTLVRKGIGEYLECSTSYKDKDFLLVVCLILRQVLRHSLCRQGWPRTCYLDLPASPILIFGVSTTIVIKDKSSVPSSSTLELMVSPMVSHFCKLSKSGTGE